MRESNGWFRSLSRSTSLTDNTLIYSVIRGHCLTTRHLDMSCSRHFNFEKDQRVCTLTMIAISSRHRVRAHCTQYELLVAWWFWQAQETSRFWRLGKKIRFYSRAMCDDSSGCFVLTRYVCRTNKHRQNKRWHAVVFLSVKKMSGCFFSSLLENRSSRGTIDVWLETVMGLA